VNFDGKKRVFLGLHWVGHNLGDIIAGGTCDFGSSIVRTVERDSRFIDTLFGGPSLGNFTSGYFF